MNRRRTPIPAAVLLAALLAAPACDRPPDGEPTTEKTAEHDARPAPPAGRVDRRPYEQLTGHLAIPPQMETRVIYFNTFSHPAGKPEINPAGATARKAGTVVPGGFFGRCLLLEKGRRLRIESPSFSPHRPLTVIAWWRIEAPLEKQNQGGGIMALRGPGRGYLSLFARGGPWCGLNDTHFVLQVYNIAGIKNVNGIFEGGFRRRYAAAPPRWHNVVLTVETGSLVGVYVDGERKQRYALSGRRFTADDNLSGIEFGGFAAGLRVDEITVLDAALKERDIARYVTALTDIRHAWGGASP